MADCVILGGPNGAGKSTSYPALRYVERPAPLAPISIPEAHFINSDVIAAAGGFNDFDAGRKTVELVNEAVTRRIDFVLETTLSGIGWAKLFDRLQREGYTIYLAFLWLRSPELSAVRVAQRAFRGSHYVPRALTDRRWSRSLCNFFRLYAPLSDFWLFVDNSDLTPQVLAWGWGQTTAHTSEVGDFRGVLEQVRQMQPESHDWLRDPRPAAHDPITEEIIRGIQKQVVEARSTLAPTDRVAVWRSGKVSFVRP